MVNSYLFPTKDEWLKSVDNLIVSAKVGDYSEMLDILGVYRFDALKELDLYQRIEILKLLVKHNKLKGNVSFGGTGEALAVNIIRSTQSNQLALLFESLQENNLMQGLCSGIDDWGGASNYTTFITVLAKKFMEYKGDEMKNIMQSDNSLADYIKQAEKSSNNKIVSFTWRKTNSNDKYGPYSSIWYNAKYKDNMLNITLGTGLKYGIQEGKRNKYNCPELNPFDIVIVYFKNVPDILGGKILPESSVAMPAFLFSWITNEYDNKKIVQYFDNAVTVASFFVALNSVGQGIKILSYIRLLAATGDVALLNDSFREYVKENLQRAKILTVWDSFSSIISLETLAEELFTSQLSTYTLFAATWAGFKQTNGYKEMANENKDFVEAIDEIVILINQNK